MTGALAWQNSRRRKASARPGRGRDRHPRRHCLRPPSHAGEPRAHRHRDDRRHRRQPAGRADRSATARQGRRLGQTGPAARRALVGRARGRPRVLRARARKARRIRSARAKPRFATRKQQTDESDRTRPRPRSTRPSRSAMRPSRTSPTPSRSSTATKRCSKAAASRRRKPIRRGRRTRSRSRGPTRSKSRSRPRAPPLSLAQVRRAASRDAAQRRSRDRSAQHAAAAAQTTKANVRLGYAELHAPVNGVVDVRAARAGEVVSPGQPVLTLVDPDAALGARRRRGELHRPRADRRLADRAPSVRRDAPRRRCSIAASTPASRRSATSSRTKRDIKTFEVRIRVDNRDRRLALGMTAYVLLPVVKMTAPVRDDAAIDVRSDHEEVRRLHGGQRHFVLSSSAARSSGCSARTAPASRRSSA